MAGKKLAVLVGCNYPGAKWELHGCINDVVAIYNTLISRFGFNPNDVVILTDAPNGIVESEQPTGANIKRALGDMIGKAKAGDVLFFHYSGHGIVLGNKHDDAIVPCDFNKITDHDIRTLVDRLPDGARFTILSDACHSGGLIDNEKEQIGPHMFSSYDSYLNQQAPLQHKSRGIHHEDYVEHLRSMSGLESDDVGDHLVHLHGEDSSPVYNKSTTQQERQVKIQQGDNGILLSGCQLDETSSDVNASVPHGAFTNALLTVLKQYDDNAGTIISNAELVRCTRVLLKEQGFGGQHPCLYCGDANAHAPFLAAPQGVAADVFSQPTTTKIAIDSTPAVVAAATSAFTVTVATRDHPMM